MEEYNPIFKIKKRDIEFFKFALVGIIGTIIHLIILYLLTEFLGIYYIVSSLLGYLLALTIGFILNKTWTFKESFKTNVINKYIKFFTVCTVSLFVNLLFLYLLTEFLNIYYLISQVLAAGISLLLNFSGSKIWTFKK